LNRSWSTAFAIAEANVRRPSVTSRVFLNETALGLLEGELKSQQSSPELSRQYRDFSKDEINYRIPGGGENLYDVADRVQRFFLDHGESLTDHGSHLIVGHRNVNKMIVRHLLGVSIEAGFCVEHDHQRLYLYLAASKEFWSYGVTSTRLMRGYETIGDATASSYA
jgi:broad specificity phosphatase PhoE